MSNNISAATDSSFDTDVVGSSIPVLVDFWATWCGPCKAIAPLLEDLAQKYEGKLKIVKLDVEANPATPPKFAVNSIPTLIIFKDGQVQATQIGLLTKTELASFIDTNI